MTEEDKIKRISELSDSDFLSFLYAEREREESLNSYQGWNIWAIGGALIAVVCAAYSILSNSNGLDMRKTIYLLSGMVSILLCYRPFILLFIILTGRERAVDYSKVKKLKDVFPVPYVFFVLLCSIICSIAIPIIDTVKPYNIVFILWVIAAVSYSIIAVRGFIKQDKVVKSYPVGRKFENLKTEQLVDVLLTLNLCLIWSFSFKRVTSPILGSEDFELAVCLVAILCLLYFGIKVILSVKKASKLDVILDEYLYNGIPKDILSKKLIIDRMGYSVLDACGHELYVLKKSIESLQEHKNKLIVLDSAFADGSFDVNNMPDYFDTIRSLDTFAGCLNKAKSILSILDQILNQDVEMSHKSESQYVSSELGIIIKDLQSYMNLSKVVDEKMKTWIQVYHCDKYGGWCVEECTLRHEKKK